MSMNRRDALRVLGCTGAVAASTAVGAAAEERRTAPPDALGLLYDTTLCIGCKSCVAACREANQLEYDRSGIPGDLYYAPTDLNERCKNAIKLYADGTSRSFVKAQCMHCVDPACTGACMVGALKKREFGIVTWDADRCIGCRYCQQVCPYEVPKFEWSKANPRIVKCELCHHRYPADRKLETQDGFSRFAKGCGPACAEVCPRGAVIYGKRDELLAEANRRLAAHPDRYVPKVFGETDGGGTQVLYLSHVPFEKLGLPELGPDSVPRTARTVQHGVYQGFIAPAALYVALGTVIWRNRRASGGGKP
jgi:Fe-S-cluster-containing dehydrogenase component